MKCQFASLSDTGRVRTNNEDAVALDPALGAVILADGMGGYKAGEVASAMATDGILQHLTETLHRPTAERGTVAQVLRRSVDAANLAIYESSLTHPQHRGMATTLVAAVFHGARLTVGHIGDSRLYRLRQGQLTQLTRDHSLLQEQIDAGHIPTELARLVPFRNLVTRAMGVSPVVDLEIHDHLAQPGDTYLLCSDGLTDMLNDDEIRQLLRQKGPLVDAAQALVDAANAAGGRDNVTVVLVSCMTDASYATTMPIPQTE